MRLTPTGAPRASQFPVGALARGDRGRPAAISARRETPSLARMCSTCELAVLGEIDSSSASSAFVSPSAILRATSNSRVVSGCHGSCSAPRPFAVRSELVGAGEQRLGAHRFGGSADLIHERSSRPRSVTIEGAPRPGRAGPRAPPTTDRAPPSPRRRPRARPVPPPSSLPRDGPGPLHAGSPAGRHRRRAVRRTNWSR